MINERNPNHINENIISLPLLLEIRKYNEAKITEDKQANKKVLI